MKHKRKSYSTSSWSPSFNGKRRRKSAKHRSSRILWVGVIAAVLALVLLLLGGLFVFLRPATRIAEDSFVYITEQTTSTDVLAELDKTRKLKNPQVARFLMERYDMDHKLRKGRYLISARMSLVQIIRTLARSSQTPIKLTFNNIRTEGELLEALTHSLEMTPEDLRKRLRDSAFCQSLGMDTLSIASIFMPDTYEVYWNVSPEDLIQKIYHRYKAYWTPEQRSKAEKKGLTPFQTSIIASIVEEESSQPKEYGTIAGLYINRYRKNMLLQADPTVKFAWGDPSIKRIRGEHLKIKSPYNTYKYVGLPPGMIRYPETSTLDAVLDAKEHDYVYMCARADFSGYHDFTASYAEHLRNARIYQQKLNERNIQ